MLSKLTPITTAITSYVQQLTWPELTPGDGRTLAVFAVFFVLFALEARFAYRKHAPSVVRQSYFTNLGSFILNDTLMSLLAVSSLWMIAERYADHGLLSGISNPYGRTLVSFLLLDLLLYGWHRLNHGHDALWVLHKVHHSDRCMNVSTAFRLHGGEIVLTTLVKAAFIVLTGIDSALLLASEAVITLFVMFHHTNIAFPGEQWLARVIVVPALHRTHHSTKRSEHDRNYGAVFSFWDRLFGTFSVRQPETLGLDRVPGQNLLALMQFGLSAGLPAQPLDLRARIAEAAYFRAERRGFVPGYEMHDWLAAEQEIIGATEVPQAANVHQTLARSQSPGLLMRSLRDTVHACRAAYNTAVATDVAICRMLASAWGRIAGHSSTCGAAAMQPGGKRSLGSNLIRLCSQDRPLASGS